VKKTAVLSLITMISLLSLSCSYGLFNFSAETGELELELQIVGDNNPGIDSVIYELTPPDGSLSVSFTSAVSGLYSRYLNIDRMNVGTWSTSVKLMAGSELYQTYDGNLDIYADGRTKLRVEAAFNGIDFSINYNWFRNDDSTDAGIVDPAFTVSDISLLPEVHLDYKSGTYFPAADIRISGSGLDSQVRNLEILYPDDSVFFTGEQNMSRGGEPVFSQSTEDALIIIRRALNLSLADINGTYVLKMTDYSQNGIRQEIAADYGELSLNVPVILGHNGTGQVPDTMPDMMVNSFEWKITDASRAGTIIALMVNLSNGAIYPNSDAMVTSGSSGTLSLPGMSLGSGNWVFIIAAVEKVFTTPYTDALALGVMPDLRPTSFAQGIKEIYGSGAGIVTFSSVPIEVVP